MCLLYHHPNNTQNQLPMYMVLWLQYRQLCCTCWACLQHNFLDWYMRYTLKCCRHCPIHENQYYSDRLNTTRTTCIACSCRRIRHCSTWRTSGTPVSCPRISIIAHWALFAFMGALFVLVLAEPTILAIRSFVVASHLITLVTLYSKVQRNKFLRGEYDSSSGYKE